MTRRAAHPGGEERRFAPRGSARGGSAALSENELVLLGLVAEEPTHAYRVEEKIRARRMAEWTEIAFSSVYRLLAGLERRGLVRSRLEHEGQGATRKVNEVTPRGRRALAAAVLEQLEALEPVKTRFQVGLAFVTHAPREEVLARLDERVRRIARARGDLEGVRAEHRASADEGPFRERRRLSVQLLLDHISEHLEVEARYVERARRLVAAAGREAFGKPS